MISPCTDRDAARIAGVINEAARAYEGVIPADCWHEPYMPEAEVRDEIGQGVSFLGYRERGELIGVMGSQHVGDVALVRHAYVAPEHQRRGVGLALLERLLSETERPVLVGTWKSATWAIDFYERHGFVATTPAETRRLLMQYWSVPERQMEESIVLVWAADPGGETGS